MYRFSYKAQVPDDAIHYVWRPRMHKIKRNFITVLLFDSGRARAMGKATKKRIRRNFYDLQITHLKSQSKTFVLKLKTCIHLPKLADILLKQGDRYIYEAELFPALKLLEFEPVCVNVFHTGKVIIMGNIKNIEELVERLLSRLACYISL